MKKYIHLILLAITTICLLSACGAGRGSAEAGTEYHTLPETVQEGTDKTEEKENAGTDAVNTDDSETRTDEAKVLVAYFSATGTTKTLAEYVAETMNADLYEIVPETPYTTEDLKYSDDNSRATKEQHDSAVRPVISGSIDNLEQYEIVFIAYPIWWGEAPRIMYTFMESYDFGGKTVIPFCTSGGSGIGTSAENLHDLTADDVNWLDGERLKGDSSREDIAEWIGSLGLNITVE